MKVIFVSTHNDFKVQTEKQYFEIYKIPSYLRREFAGN